MYFSCFIFIREREEMDLTIQAKTDGDDEHPRESDVVYENLKFRR